MGKDKKILSFLEKSHKKMDELAEKLRHLSKKEPDFIKEGKAMPIKEENANVKEVKISISVESVVKCTIAILLLIGLVTLLGVIKNIIIIFLVALFLAATLTPAVDRLEQFKIPRAIGILILYILIIGIFVVMFSSLVPIVAKQIEQLALGAKDMIQNLVTNPSPNSWFMQKIQPFANQIWQNIDQTQIINQLTDTLKGIASNLTSFAGNAIGVIFVVFNGIFNLLMILIITFFMISNAKHTNDFFRSLFPRKYSAYISLKTKQISFRIGEWMRGQLFLALAMALLTFTILSIIGLNYALTLSLLAGLGEFLPYLGPMITFSSVILVALNQSPILALWLIPIYAVIMLIEGNVLIPLIVGRVVGMNSIVVLFSLFCGATIGVDLGGSFGLGLVGMILAVPIANIISLFVEDYTVKNK